MKIKISLYLFIVFMIFSSFVASALKPEKKDFIEGKGCPSGVFTVSTKPSPTPTVGLRSINIQGRISLPDNEIAPAGGLVICIKAFLLKSGKSTDYQKAVDCTLEEGKNNLEYSIPLDPSREGCYLVCYDIMENSFDYVPYAYYSSKNSKAASYVHVGKFGIENIDLRIEKLIAIEGTVSLPDNELAPAGGIRMDMYATPFKSTTYYQGYTVLTIPQGKNSANYKLMAAPDNKLGYLIQYDFRFCQVPYIRCGYYQVQNNCRSSRTPTPVSTGKESIRNIDIMLQKGVPINGTVALPNNDTAPKGGIKVYISAQCNEYIIEK